MPVPPLTHLPLSPIASDEFREFLGRIDTLSTSTPLYATVYALSCGFDTQLVQYRSEQGTREPASYALHITCSHMKAHLTTTPFPSSHETTRGGIQFKVGQQEIHVDVSMVVDMIHRWCDHYVQQHPIFMDYDDGRPSVSLQSSHVWSTPSESIRWFQNDREPIEHELLSREQRYRSLPNLTTHSPFKDAWIMGRYETYVPYYWSEQVQTGATQQGRVNSRFFGENYVEIPSMNLQPPTFVFSTDASGDVEMDENS